MHIEGLSENRRINEIELLRLFYKNKGLIILSTLLGLVIGFAVLFFSQPVYEAKIRITAASDGDIAPFNQGRSWGNSPLKPIKTKDVHLSFSRILLSDDAKEDFFRMFYLPALTASQKEKRSPEQWRAYFLKSFTIMPNPMTALDRFASYTIALRGPNGKQAAHLLQQFMARMQEQTVMTVIQDLQKQNAVLMGNLRQQIEIARHAAKAQRLDRIAQLKEKLHTIRLASAKTPFWDDEPAVMNDGNEVLPLNSEAIQSEIKSLAARQSDDAFVPNLRQLQAKLEFYQSLKIDPASVKVFHLDGEIKSPEQPIAPRKKLVLLLALALGFMSGVLGVMVRIAWRGEQFKSHAASCAA